MPILPLGMGGTRSYDNFVYPKEAASPAQVIISPEDVLAASADASEEIAAGDVYGGRFDTLADKYYGINQLDRDWELQALEEELRRQRLAEYERYGITREGKAYYYQGQLVNIFLDRQTGAAFYTLDMNPNGTVNINIIRGEDGVIQGVDYMTREEEEELFGNMYGPDDE